jgi:hypothetical protein
MLHVHAACPCCISVSHVHSACHCCMFVLHVLAACPCSGCCQFSCCLSIMHDILHVHFACQCPMSMLHVFMLNVHSARPSSLSMLHVQAVCPGDSYSTFQLYYIASSHDKSQLYNTAANYNSLLCNTAAK